MVQIWYGFEGILSPSLTGLQLLIDHPKYTFFGFGQVLAFSQIVLLTEMWSVKSSLSLFINLWYFLEDVDFKNKYILLLNTYKQMQSFPQNLCSSEFYTICITEKFPSVMSHQCT